MMRQGCSGAKPRARCFCHSRDKYGIKIHWEFSQIVMYLALGLIALL